jgi:delta 1-pyrroline-5-carboxylate dehydrogenase
LRTRIKIGYKALFEMSLSDLKRKDLFQQKGYINAEWVSAKSGKTFDVIDPATLKKIATVPEMGAAETALAVDAAYAAFQDYKKTTARQRARVSIPDSSKATGPSETMIPTKSTDSGRC